MTSACVTVRALTKYFRGGFGRPPIKALRSVDLSVPQGCTFGLIGPNGAGKSTLLKVLLGLVQPSAGEVRVLGRPPGDPRVRAQVGYLPERLHMPETLSAHAFLRSIARLKGVAGHGDESERQLTRVGLWLAREAKIGKLSKGMRQRLGLATALLGNPELLVLDEPTDGIDPPGRALVRTLLAEERSRGATVLLNSHLLGETERSCEEICVLAQGRVATTGPVAALFSFSEAVPYLVRFQAVHEPALLATLGFFPASEPGAYACHAEELRALHARLDLARAHGLVLTELRPLRGPLEKLLLGLLEEPHG